MCAIGHEQERVAQKSHQAGVCMEMHTTFRLTSKKTFATDVTYMKFHPISPNQYPKVPPKVGR